MQTSAAPVTDLKTLDQTLGPTSAVHHRSDPAAVILALLAKGSLTKTPPKVVRAWIESRLKDRRPDVVQMVRSARWKELTLASEAWIAGARSATISLPPRAARRMVARVLSEFSGRDTKTSSKPLSGHLMVQARHTAAVIGLEAIRYGHLGRDTVIISDPWISVMRGLERTTARRHRHILTDDFGWLRLVAGGRAGFPARVRFNRLPKAVGELVATPEFFDTIGQIVSPDEDGMNLLASLFSSAAHPAWTYSSEQTSAHWLVAVADAAGVEPVTLGVTARRVPAIRKTLTALLGAPAERDARRITEALDAHAIEMGAFAAFEAAETARRVAAQERKEAVLAVREVKREAAETKASTAQTMKDARKLKAREARLARLQGAPTASVVPETVEAQGVRLAATLLELVGALPDATAGQDEVDGWLAAAEPRLAACKPDLRLAIATHLYEVALEEDWIEAKAGYLARIAAGPSEQIAA